MSGARPWLRSESMPLLQRGVAGRDHPALAGGQLLVGVEAEDRRVAAGADRDAVGVDAPSASQASSTIGRPRRSKAGRSAG